MDIDLDKLSNDLLIPDCFSQPPKRGFPEEDQSPISMEEFFIAIRYHQ